MKPVFTVLAAGNAGFGLAGDLAIRGFEVRLCDFPEYEVAIAPVRRAGGITLSGVRGVGFAPLKMATVDVSEAVQGADIILVASLAAAHGAWGEALAPHLDAGQIVLIQPGHVGGALEFRKRFLEAGGTADVIVAEAPALVLLCRKDGPAEASVAGVKKGVPVAAFPATKTQHVLDTVWTAYPEFVSALNVLDTSLNNVNHPVHVAAMLLNLGRVEHFGGGWHIFHEGMTPSVCRLMEGLDRERLAMCAALGLPQVSLLEWFLRFYGDQGLKGRTLFEALSTTPVHRGRAPNDISHRHFSNDVPYGLMPLSSIGRVLEVPTPVIDGLITVVCAATGQDYSQIGRTVERLGLAGVDATRLMGFVEAGFLD